MASAKYHLIERNQQGFSWIAMQIFLGGQIAYLSPGVFIVSVVAIIGAGLQAFKKNGSALFIFAFSVPYIALFLVAGCLSPTSKPHWTAMGYISSFLFLLPHFQHVWKNHSSMKNKCALWSYLSTFTISCIFTVLLFIQAKYPLIPLTPEADTTNELYGWNIVASHIEQAMHDLKKNGSDAFIFAPGYQIASQIAFQTENRYPVYSITSSSEQYDVWGRGELADELISRNALFVADNRFRQNLTEKYLFDSVEAIPPLVVQRAGRDIRWFYLYRCINFQGKAKKSG